MTTTLQRKQPRQSGFSLVEIVVAVGIVATVMVALLGMIPTGLNAVNEAADTMAEIRIAQKIMGEIQMTEWDDLDEWDDGALYYDNEGSLLETPEKNKIRYTCRVEIDDEFQLPGTGAVNDLVRNITIKISSKRGGTIDFSDTAPTSEYRSFSTVSVMTQSVQSFEAL